MNGRTAMILAAGKGTRMGALSDTLPKPLTMVKGVSLMDRLFAHFTEASVEKIIVNVHHLADQMETALNEHITSGLVEISDERGDLLETGGGVRHALPYLGTAPFFVVNGDALWVDAAQSNLTRLKEAWNSDEMDVLLLLVPRAEALGYEGVGDFFMENNQGVNPLQFRDDADSAPYVFGGVLLINPTLYDDTPEGAWSNRIVFRKAAAAGRLYGLEIDGHWMHVGTPEAITAAEEKLDVLGAD